MQLYNLIIAVYAMKDISLLVKQILVIQDLILHVKCVRLAIHNVNLAMLLDLQVIKEK